MSQSSLKEALLAPFSSFATAVCSLARAPAMQERGYDRIWGGPAHQESERPMIST